MRVLLIDVDNDRSRTEAGHLYGRWSHHPIGLMYLAASARQAFPDVDIRIFHTSTSDDPRRELAELAAAFRPQLVGLRTLSINLPWFATLADDLRAAHPALPLIAGGPGPSASFREILAEGMVDLVVIGEGESAFVELLGRLQQDSRLPTDLIGTAAMVDGQVKVNAARPAIAELDSIPFPDYQAIELEDYRPFSNHAYQSAAESAFICATRGCPYRCFYCHQLFEKKIRRRTPANVIAEMRAHVDQRGISSFVFVDDLFNVPKPQAKDMLRAIAAELPGVRLNFPNGLRADQLDEEMIDLFEAAGTVQMSLAVETAVPRLQKMIGKNLNPDKAWAALDAASRRFIVCGFFMIGFPSETYEEAMENIRFAASLEYMTQPVLNVLRLFPGTSLYDALAPTPEQERGLAEQQQALYTPKLHANAPFYGDLFTREQVPLTGELVAQLRWEWVARVIHNKARVTNGHKVLQRHLSEDRIMALYRDYYDNPKFNEKHLKAMMSHELTLG